MQANTIFLPILVPMVTAVICMIAWYKPKFQRWISLASSIIMVLISLWMLNSVIGGSIWTVQAGHWSAPYGISFVYDGLSGALILTTSIVSAACSLFAGLAIRSNRASFGFFPLFQFLLLGLYGAYLAGDIFNLYVWFEVIIISSFVLITLGGEKSQLAGAVKYVTLNMLASVIFLSGIAVLFGTLGTLNLADLSEKIANLGQDNLINTIGVLFFVAFGIKAAIFPLYFWLPDAYPTPPAVISAIFGGLLTKVGIYAYLRVFSLLFIQDHFIQQLMMYIAILTMVIGAIGALRQQDMRKLISFLIVSHIGFLLSGIALHSKEGYTGSAYYLIHDMVGKTSLFLVTGLLFKIRGSFDIRDHGNLANDYPRISIFIVLAALTVAGTPPFSGFWPKLILIKESWVQGAYHLTTGIILASAITLWVLAGLVSKILWGQKEHPEMKMGDSFFEKLKPIRKAGLLLSIISLLIVSISLGFFYQPLYQFFSMVSSQLLEPYSYIQSVLSK